MRVGRLLFADWPEIYFSGQSEGGISNASGTPSVRVSAQGLSRSCCKLSPMKIPSSRPAAPGSPRMLKIVQYVALPHAYKPKFGHFLRIHSKSFSCFFCFLFFFLSILFTLYPLSPFYPLEKFRPQPFREPGSGTLIN